MKNTSTVRFGLVTLALAATVGCGGGSKKRNSAGAAVAPATSNNTASPTTNSTTAPPTTASTPTTPTVANVTSGHGVIEVRGIGAVTSYVIVRDGDYAELEVKDPRALIAAGVRDGRTVSFEGELASATLVDVKKFTADSADLHGRIRELPTFVIKPMPVPSLPGIRLPRPVVVTPVAKKVVFEADSGERFTLSGALATKVLGTPNVQLWRGLRITGLVKQLPSVTGTGELEVTSFDLDRVVEHRANGGLLALNQSTVVELGARCAEFFRTTYTGFIRPVERRSGKLTRVEIRDLDKLVKAADLFAKADVYNSQTPIFDAPVQRLIYRTIDKEKTIVIQANSQLPAEVDAVVKRLNEIAQKLPK